MQNLQHFSDLRCRLACLKINDEPQANTSDTGKLILPQVLFLASRSDQSTDIGWAFDLF